MISREIWTLETSLSLSAVKVEQERSVQGGVGKMRNVQVTILHFLPLFTDVDNSKSDALYHRNDRHQVGSVYCKLEHYKQTLFPFCLNWKLIVLYILKAIRGKI